MAEEKLLTYLEDRVIKLQNRINELQELIKHYRAVLNDYKKEHRIDYPVVEEARMEPKEESITL